MRVGWMLLLVAVTAGCGSGGSSSGSGNGGNGASSSGGSSSGGSSAGGSGATSGSAGVGGSNSGGSSAGGASSGGWGGADAGPVIPGGACVEPIATPPSPACAEGQPVQSYCRQSNPSELVMATCQSGGMTQCEAGDACGKGWHFCAGTEYLDRGGRTVPKAAGIVYAWIAACVRDATGNELKDGPCSVCDQDVGAQPGMIYGCNGEDISPGMIDDSIGANADTACHRIGENVPAAAGYWSINWSGHKSGHTLCCIDGA